MKGSSRTAARHASTRSRSATDLRTYPLAPALRASKKYCSLSYIVRIRIRRAGRRPDARARARAPGLRGEGELQSGEIALARGCQLPRLRAVARLGHDREVR